MVLGLCVNVDQIMKEIHLFNVGSTHVPIIPVDQMQTVLQTAQELSASAGQIMKEIRS